MKSITFVLATLLLSSSLTFAQGTRDDFARAERLSRTANSLVLYDQVRLHWSTSGDHLLYRVNTGRNEHRFVLVDLQTGEKTTPAFDHIRLAEALRAATGEPVRADNLPLEQIDVTGTNGGRQPSQILFRASGKSWRFDLGENIVFEDIRPPDLLTLLPPRAARRGSRQTGESTSLTFENATDSEIEILWIDPSGERRSYGRIGAGATQTQHTYAGHMWLVTDGEGVSLAAVEGTDAPALARIERRVSGSAEPSAPQGLSPDGRWTAFIREHNLFVRSVGDGDDGENGDGEEVQLSHEGSSDDRYQGPLLWSPDSQKLVAFRAEEVEHRQVYIVDSSPSNQLQPNLRSFNYRKPGDPIPQPMPRLFDVESRAELVPDNALFDNPWRLHDPAWAPDSSELSFAYNQRGHQVMRIVGIDAEFAVSRVIHEEVSDTFIDYSQKFFLRRLPDTRELLWASERDGYNHLYLIDELSGEIKHQVTAGDWNVRDVVEVDVENRTVLMRAVGLSENDPYHVHFVRAGFDGSGFTQLTESDGTHRIEFSPCQEFLVATWSRVDQPPVTELRRSANGELVVELERADDSAVLATGLTRTERFTAKGRDGETDIHGIIIRPSNFDPANEYPVVENIYAGPHSHFVPQSYSAWTGLHAIAELGFIVVKMDGMGTNWRGKKFHDVAWKNLADAGLPDRIAWIRAAAETRPWMDLSRVGIYGGSAGGQSSVAALLHHGDFYKVAVADCGCHDNRMDKIWWNEAWMGWPVDESYEQNSNMTHAAKLTGKLLLIVGELDTNVDPASTYQLVHALQQADKDFDFIPIMGAGHGAAETPYGRRQRANFLIRHLHGVEPGRVVSAEGTL